DPAGLSVEELEQRFARRFVLLSPRERQVCARAAAGLGVAETARELGIAETSVLTYRQRAYQRLRVASSLALRALVTHWSATTRRGPRLHGAGHRISTLPGHSAFPESPMRAYFFAGRASVLSLILASMVPWSATTAQTGTAIAVEGGAVWQSRNTARIPNSDAGTRFSLRDLQGGGAEAYFRVDGTWQFGERHQLRALYAPYAITRSGIPDTALQFDGTTFAAGEPTEVHYQFDS